MTDHEPRTEGQVKGAGNDESPMGRFKILARKLINVNPSELAEQRALRKEDYRERQRGRRRDSG